MVDQPKGIPEGIYFNLSNEDYHNDPALSHSGMTKLLVSWPDYWVNSCLNPHRKPWKTTPAMEFGQRSGMLLLQPKLFHETYNTYGKSRADSRGAWLSSIQWTDLHESVDAIMEVEIARKHFVDGYPEVSIFWKDPGTGVMLRARVDYLRTFGCIDFKRIADINNYAIGRAVKAQGLDIQNFLYLEAVKAARAMLKRMSDVQLMLFVTAENISLEWLKAFRDDHDLLFRFLFQRSTPPYIWEFREIENEVLTEGANAVFSAVKLYRSGLDKFGVGKPPLGQNAVKKISQYHVPRREYDYEQ